MSGKAYLVGAGPGRADLITVRGLNLLRAADVVLYDHLIARELLAEIRPDAEQIFVGKTAGRHALRQEQINAVLVERTRAGLLVVRLKGGDPFVFGRGGEEALALAEAGMPFEVVPGVSSALAAPAYAGIPVTHRAVSTAFAVVAGHEAPDKAGGVTDWEALARVPTLVVLMPLKRAAAICEALIGIGRDPATPAAAISWGVTDRQQVVRATIDTLPQAISAYHLPSPTLLVIGEVAALSDTLAWFQPDGGAEGFIGPPE